MWSFLPEVSTLLVFESNRFDVVFVLIQDHLKLLRGEGYTVQGDLGTVEHQLLVLNDVHKILELSTAQRRLQKVHHQLPLRVGDTEQPDRPERVDVVSERCSNAVEHED